MDIATNRRISKVYIVLSLICYKAGEIRNEFDKLGTSVKALKSKGIRSGIL